MATSSITSSPINHKPTFTLDRSFPELTCRFLFLLPPTMFPVLILVESWRCLKTHCLQTPPRFHEKTPREEPNTWAGKEKTRIFGLPPGRPRVDHHHPRQPWTTSALDHLHPEPPQLGPTPPPKVVKCSSANVPLFWPTFGFSESGKAKLGFGQKWSLWCRSGDVLRPMFVLAKIGVVGGWGRGRRARGERERGGGVGCFPSTLLKEPCCLQIHSHRSTEREPFLRDGQTGPEGLETGRKGDLKTGNPEDQLTGRLVGWETKRPAALK